MSQREFTESKHVWAGAIQMSSFRFGLGLLAVSLIFGWANAATYVVTNTSDSGPGSLRQALLDANANSGMDLIDFNIVGPGPHIIQPLSPLPSLNDNAGVIIDGYSQPGTTVNTCAPGEATNAVLTIVLNGSLAGASSGLNVTSSNNIIQGLVVNGCFEAGIRLTGPGATGNTIQGCFIGTDETGTSPAPNDDGILIELGAGTNTVGGAAADATMLIAMNVDAGVRVTGGTANRVTRCQIHANGGLGIDLGPVGVTANDEGDVDSGANDLQNFPVITDAHVDPDGSMHVAGTVDTAAGSVLVELFATGWPADPSKHGEGARYLGFVSTTDGAWDMHVSASVVNAAGLQHNNSFISATATRNTNTSEMATMRCLWHVPTPISQVLNVVQGHPRSITLTAIDVDNDSLTFEVVDRPADGTLYGTAPNLSYVPKPGFAGVDTFTFVAHDHCLTSDPETIYLYVSGDASCGRIYFQSDRDGQNEIYRMRPDGSGMVNLTGHGANDNQPRVSPDGKSVAFFSDRDNPLFELYVMDADGENVHRVTSGTGLDMDCYPGGIAWSNDGLCLFFCTKGPRALYRVELDGSNLTLIHAQPGTDTYGPDLSPDGSSLLVTQNDTGDGMSAELFTMSASGAGITALTESEGDDHNRYGQWNSDGTAVLFSAYRTAFGDASRLMMMRVGGAATRLGTPAADAIWPRWGPRDARVVYASDQDGNYEIYVLRSDREGLTRLTHDAATDTAPDWGNTAPEAKALTLGVVANGSRPISLTGTDADGDALSFHVATGPTNGRLSGAPTLTYTPDRDFEGTDSFTYYACDGDKTSPPATVYLCVVPGVTNGRIYFQTNRDGNNEIYSMRPDGSGLTNLTNNPSDDTFPRVSPDGTKVAFYSTRDAANGDVYIMKADGSSLQRVTNAGLNLANAGGNLTWSPDGTQLAFISVPWALYRVNVDGTGLMLVHQDANEVYGPDYAPDGTRFCITKNAPGDAGSAEVYVLNADGSGLTAITSSPDPDHSQLGVWSKDGNVLMFDAQVSANKDLLLMKSDGTGPTPFTDLGSETAYPRWSPSNAGAVFQTDKDGNGELYRVGIDGSGLVRLTNDAAEDLHPDWGNVAPVAAGLTLGVLKNGNRAVTLRGTDADGDTLSFKVVATPANGYLSGLAPNLTYRPRANFMGTDSFSYKVCDGTLESPVVTATLYVVSDGASGRIYFQSDRDGNSEIYSMRHDGSDVTNLTAHPAEDRHPRVSPDGRKVAFLSNRDSANFDIYVCNSDGSGAQRKPTGLDLSLTPSGLAWSPDGSQLYFCPNAPRSLYRIDVSGANLTQLHAAGGTDVYAPDVSPDGSTLTFTSNDTGDAFSAEVHTANADGSGVLAVTDAGPGQPHCQFSSWSNDGGLLLFAGYRTALGTKEIFLMKADGTGPTTLTAVGGSNQDTTAPSWGPVNSNVVFHSNKAGNYEIYRINVDGSDAANLTSNGAQDRFPDWGNVTPQADNDSYTTMKGVLIDVAVPGVMANDVDLDGDPMTAERLTNPAHGSLLFNQNGSFRYIPHATFEGTDSFTYRVTDGCLFSAPATVTIQVDEPDFGPPVAREDTYSTQEDEELVVPFASGVLANDVDSNGRGLEADLQRTTSEGTLALNSDGSFSYTPPADFHGDVTFAYRADDGERVSNTVTVTIRVTPVNDAPIAHIDASPLVVATRQPVLFDGSGSSDPEGLELTFDWSFADGSHGNAEREVHFFDAAGVYKVTLMVRDPGGRFGMDQVEVFVVEIDPPPPEQRPRPSISVTVTTRYRNDGNGGGDDDDDGDDDDGDDDDDDDDGDDDDDDGDDDDDDGDDDDDDDGDDDDDDDGDDDDDDDDDDDNDREDIGGINTDVEHVITLDASGSTDPVGTVVSFLWEFEDRTVFHGPIIIKTVRTEGFVKGTLTIFNDRGVSNEVDFRVLVLADLREGGGDVGHGSNGDPGLYFFKCSSVFDKDRQDQVMFKIKNFAAEPGDRISVMVGRNRWGALFQHEEDGEFDDLILDNKCKSKSASGTGQVVQLKISKKRLLMFKAVRTDFIDSLDYRAIDDVGERTGTMDIPIQIIRIRPDNSKVKHSFYVPVSFKMKVRNKTEEFALQGKIYKAALLAK